LIIRIPIFLAVDKLRQLLHGLDLTIHVGRRHRSQTNTRHNPIIIGRSILQSVQKVNKKN